MNECCLGANITPHQPMILESSQNNLWITYIMYNVLSNFNYKCITFNGCSYSGLYHFCVFIPNVAAWLWWLCLIYA